MLPQPEFASLLLADGRLPVGAHTQSSGLEPALLGGLEQPDIPALIATRLRTVVVVDTATAVVARHRTLAALPLDEVQLAWAARTPSEIVRGASVAVGRGQRRLAQRLWPDSATSSALARMPAPARPVAVGAMAAAAGLDGARTARLVAYDDVQSLCAAALKLCPLDPIEATEWLLRSGPAVEELVATVAHLTEPDDIPAPSAPLLEHWQHAHPTHPRRLFSA
ncbi:urease accessory protein [Pedococcus dokdonensis]|uniref:Urease accessory protein n=1 Tax=Pedococcus dokdonensis TaxID=443156 RepID=A0A1H0V3G2_9MICO|nr:urease accessory UreF family protein [Pedococcus dokdonensis]SDP72616.1 urease accessory protein [Pedococcus dokdonensis]